MPTGTKVDDGFATLITMSGATGAGLWEKRVKPPGVDGGDPNDTTTMRNTAWRTMSPRKLKSLTPARANCAYDPAVYSILVAQINVIQTITVTHPNGSTLAFKGYLRSFEPNENKEGEQPTADAVFQPSNQDSSGAESAPVYTAGP